MLEITFKIYRSGKDREIVSMDRTIRGGGESATTDMEKELGELLIKCSDVAMQQFVQDHGGGTVIEKLTNSEGDAPTFNR